MRALFHFLRSAKGTSSRAESKCLRSPSFTPAAPRVVLRHCLEGEMMMLAVHGSFGASPPHIVALMSDDLGWNNIGFHNPAVHSPNIDALRYDGIELTRHYAYKVWSPTHFGMPTSAHYFLRYDSSVARLALPSSRDGFRCT